MSIHHKICHVLGGSFDLPHAPIHCLMLPYSTAYNAEAAPEAMACISRALGADSASAALHKLMKTTNKKQTLAEFGMSEADLDRAADIAVQKPYWNPRPVTRDGVREMLQKAWCGVVP